MDVDFNASQATRLLHWLEFRYRFIPSTQMLHQEGGLLTGPSIEDFSFPIKSSILHAIDIHSVCDRARFEYLIAFEKEKVLRMLIFIKIYV